MTPMLQDPRRDELIRRLEALIERLTTASSAVEVPEVLTHDPGLWSQAEKLKQCHATAFAYAEKFLPHLESFADDLVVIEGALAELELFAAERTPAAWPRA